MTDIKKQSQINQPNRMGINPSKFVSSYNKGNDNKGLTSSIINKNKNKTKTDVNIALVVVIILGIVGIVLVVLHFKIGLFKKKDDVPLPSNNTVKLPDIIEQEQEVFFVNADNEGNKYKKENVENVCRGLDSKLATYSQLLDAVNKGANWCQYGWLNDNSKDNNNNNNNKIDVYGYTVNDDNTCTPKLNDAPSQPITEVEEFGVNCFGVKPDMDTEFKTQLTQKKQEKAKILEEEEAQEKEFLERVKGSDILPFNKDKWSSENNNSFYSRNKECDKLKEKC
jgi:hypothetical protein